MPTQIERDAFVVLEALASTPRNEELDGEEIHRRTGLDPDRINEVVWLLDARGLAERFEGKEMTPFEFSGLEITTRGRYQYQKASEVMAVAANVLGLTSATADQSAATALQPPTPVGSPYGFTKGDWEVVARRKTTTDRVHVVLGFQFASSYYDTETLKQNVLRDFADAIARYNTTSAGTPVALHFAPLAAGYGEHLFNEIARDIISADIAVFDASDLNPNVMLEMGVALTWGVIVLPIKAEGRPRPPSDVSGHTWADYRESGSAFLDPDHQAKLVRMIERAVRKKSAV